MWRFLILLPSFSLFADLSALYLSWYEDPTTSMVIQWHTPIRDPRFDAENANSDTLSFASADDDWQSIEGEHTVLDQLVVHKVTLENLTPNTEYAFSIESNPKIYRFRTAPAELDEPLRFIVGSDIYASTKMFRRMSKTVMENKPHFAVIGGDLAGVLSMSPFSSSSFRRWCAFLKDWKDHMIDEEGRILPFLIVAGHHDAKTDDLFFNLFAFPERQLYRAIDFGNYLSLILLDTGHFQPIEGAQTTWLDETLATRSAPFRFAVYHEAAYPSDPNTSPAPQGILTHWTPLFEKHQLSAAFENNSPVFKRTYPLKAGQIDPSGVVYIGDGTWNSSPHNTHDLWYLAKSERKNSLVLVELTQTEATVKALDMLNNFLDELSFFPINK